MSPKLYIFTGSDPCLKVMLSLYYCNVDFELVAFKDFGSVQTEEFLKINPHGKVPALETEDGTFIESNAILGYVAKKYTSFKLYSNELKEQMEIDQFFHHLETTYESKFSSIIYSTFGFPFPTVNYKLDVHRNSIRDCSSALKNLDKILDNKLHCVLGRYTTCDILLFTILSFLMKFVYDENQRKQFPNLVKWLENFVNQEFYKKNLGKYRFCNKQFSIPQIDLSKKAQKPVEKKKEENLEQEEKPKKLVLPETKFNLYNFKTYFVNEPDRLKAAEKMLEDYDDKAFSFYHLKYIKYGDEGKVTFLTSNLMNGFLDRAEHMRKHCLGVHAVLGDEPCLEIEGVWMWQWVDGMFPLMKEHVQYEVYDYIKLDPKKEEDRKLILSFLVLFKEDEDKFNGKTARVIKIVK